MRRTLLAALAVLLIGCTTGAASVEQTTLRVVMADDWASAPVVGEVIDAFEREHPGLRVQVHGSPFSQIPELVTAADELDQPYDLAHWHAFAAAAGGFARGIDDLWASAGLTEEMYLPGAVRDVTWDGRRYGVPLDVNAMVLMANRNQLAAAELTEDDLAEIDDLAEHAAALADLEGSDHAIAITASSWSAYGWIVAGGGQLLETGPDGELVLDEESRPTFTFDDPATVGAVANLVELVEVGDAPPPSAPDLALDAVAAFAEGRAPLHASGSWDLPLTRRVDPAAVETEDVAVLPLPQADPDDPRTVLGGSSLFLPKGSEHPELAFELMLALTERDVGLALVEQEGRLPARVDAYDDPLFESSPDLAAFVRQLEHAEIMPLIAYPELAIAFGDALEAALAGRATAAEAMAQVQRRAEAWTADG
ncbi:MAG: extracellular solute-binding protein [Nitriliruptoraceae bacterium]